MIIKSCCHSNLESCPSCEPQQISVSDYNKPTKCSQCGSTAIDHTEARCMDNRGIAYFTKDGVVSGTPLAGP